MTVNYKNTFVIRTDDENFNEVIGKFISEHCSENRVNAACYDLTEECAEKVLEVVFNEG